MLAATQLPRGETGLFDVCYGSLRVPAHSLQFLRQDFRIWSPEMPGSNSTGIESARLAGVSENYSLLLSTSFPILSCLFLFLAFAVLCLLNATIGLATSRQNAYTYLISCFTKMILHHQVLTRQAFALTCLNGHPAIQPS